MKEQCLESVDILWELQEWRTPGTVSSSRRARGAVTSLQHRAAPRSETGQSPTLHRPHLHRETEMESSHPRELLGFMQQSCRISPSCAPDVIAQVESLAFESVSKGSYRFSFCFYMKAEVHSVSHSN